MSALPPPLRIGFVGSGFIAWFHLKSFLSVRHVQISGVYSPTPPRRQALAEAVNALTKTELIRGPSQGPWRTVEDVELATLGWVHWHNNERLHGYLNDVPPVEFEAAYAAQQTDQQLVGIQ